MRDLSQNIEAESYAGMCPLCDCELLDYQEHEAFVAWNRKCIGHKDCVEEAGAA